jgi:hypothetical protein
MAYQPVRTFNHGDQVVADTFNRISNNQNVIHGLVGDTLVVPLICWNEENGPNAATRENSSLVFIHSARWLYFRSNGEIYPMRGDEEPVQLNESNGEITLFDLDDVAWLDYGMAYRVVGCTVAGEYYIA